MLFFISECSICEDSLGEELYFSPPRRPKELCPSHHLFEYFDTAFHQRCDQSWPHLREFSEICSSVKDLGFRLIENKSFVIDCGPFVYGPRGKMNLPYYVKAKLKSCPITLKSSYLNWPKYLASKAWEPKYMAESGMEIEQHLSRFPQGVESLNQLALPHIIHNLQTSGNHRVRYISVLSLGLTGPLTPETFAVLEQSKFDDHGSVQQASRMLLKANSVES